jgi:hypothetical protein|eukprot:3148377-Prymnesium_polylepis.1
MSAIAHANERQGRAIQPRNEEREIYGGGTELRGREYDVCMRGRQKRFRNGECMYYGTENRFCTHTYIHASRQGY